ncbi:hypothetical protein EK904_012235 [Melospiza melodia maxima]|nr:hypothetical protein EK904_012235 [Melospiza melodia maxima]
MMADSGTDVTVLPKTEWLCDWELVSPCGTISGIEGAVNYLRSKYLTSPGPHHRRTGTTLRPSTRRWRQDRNFANPMSDFPDISPATSYHKEALLS